jgi:hypothetical protein
MNLLTLFSPSLDTGIGLQAQIVFPVPLGERSEEGGTGMTKQLGFPHPHPLPVGEGAKFRGGWPGAG